MIDLVKMESLLNLPDDTPAEDRRTAVLSALEMMKDANEAEKATADIYKKMEEENKNLKRQNVDLYNRVAKTILPNSNKNSGDSGETPEEKNEKLLEEIRGYY